MYGWGNSGSVWYRHFLHYLGVDLSALHWCIGPVDAPRPSTAVVVLPPGVTQPPEGMSLAQMLIAGELDAVYSPPIPKDYHPTHGPIVRLFPDYKPIEQQYFRDTGAYPPQHLMLVRRAVWEQNKWIARSLTEGFIACEDMFNREHARLPVLDPLAGGRTGRNRRDDGRGFPPVWFREEPGADRDVLRPGVCRGSDVPQGHARGVFSRSSWRPRCYIVPLEVIMIDWSKCPDAERIPGKASGAWLVIGTRIPIQGILGNAEDRYSPRGDRHGDLRWPRARTRPAYHRVCAGA